MATEVDVSLNDNDKKNSKSYRIKLSNTKDAKELFPDLDLAIQFLDSVNVDTDKNKTAKLLSSKISKSVLETSEIVTINKDELDEAITSDIRDILLSRLGVNEEIVAPIKERELPVVNGCFTYLSPLVENMSAEATDMLNYIKKLEAKRSKRLLNCKPYLSRKYKKVLTKLIRRLIISLNNKYKG